MDKWLQQHLQVSVDEAALIVASLVPILSLILPPVRRFLRGLLGELVLAFGRPQARYRAWFLHEHGTLKNIYLNRVEVLDLAETYVSLSVQSDDASDSRVVATQLMAPSGPRHIMLIGDPGTGKSTLLKAYGSGVLRSRERRRKLASDLEEIAPTGEFPVFIALRQVASFVDRGGTLEEYILDLLQRRTRTSGARRLFRQLLLQGRMVVLLDGLDELSESSYRAVRVAIHDFVYRDEDNYLPTSMARLIISCRRQNFFQFKDDWIGWFSERYFTIAPLRDHEIIRFIEKRKNHFSDTRPPETFKADIQASGTLELHRIPLILTISLGLYTQLAAYEIPHSIGEFYEEMIKELLRRHDFRADNKFAANRFRSEDKHRFLRELAWHLCQRPTPFADFYYDEMVAFCEQKHPGMPRLHHEQIREFINEIIDRSGLLMRTSDEDQYAYAHRAFHEYLVAAQLGRDPFLGAEYLLERVHDPEWRQTVIFFCALDNPQVAPFLTRLATKSAELAGHCLAAAVVPDHLAASVIRKLRNSLDDGHLQSTNVLPLLSALVQATHSPAQEIRGMAFDALQDELIYLARSVDAPSQRQVFRGLFGGELPVAAKLLHLMAENSSAKVAAAIANLARVMPDDEPGLVAPLWRCLSVPGVSHTPIARTIVRRLLVLVMNPVCFAEFQKLPKLQLDWVPDSHRRAAYPLGKGLPHDSNLVTLLGCAYTLKATDDLSERNMYLQALDAPGQPLKHLDHRTAWRSRIRFFIAARMAAYAVFALCVAGSVAAAFVAEPDLFITPSFWTTLIGVHVVTVILVVTLTWVALAKYERHGFYGTFSRTAYLIPIEGGPTAAFHIPQVLGLPHRLLSPRPPSVFIGFIFGYLALAYSVLYFPVSVIYTLPFMMFFDLPLWAVSVLAVTTLVTFFWLPTTELCGSFSSFFSPASQKFSGIYDDPKSRHWIVPEETMVRAAARPDRPRKATAATGH